MGISTSNLPWITAGVLPPVPVKQEDGGPAAYDCSCGDGCVFPGCSQCPGLSPASSISPLGSWRDTLATHRTWDSITVAGDGKAPSINYPCVFQPHPWGPKLGADPWCQPFSQSSSQESLGLVRDCVAMGCKDCWSLSLLTWEQGRWPAPGTYMCRLLLAAGLVPPSFPTTNLWQEKPCSSLGCGIAPGSFHRLTKAILT